jgi:hypothetical protein
MTFFFRPGFFFSATFGVSNNCLIIGAFTVGVEKEGVSIPFLSNRR